MRAGRIIPAVIDIDRASEFTGDDVDRFSELVDLGENFSKVLVWIPVLDAEGVVSLYVQRDSKVATVPVQMQAMDADATGHFAHATSSGAGSIAVPFEIGGAQYLRIHVAADQAADRTFYIRGC